MGWRLLSVSVLRPWLAANQLSFAGAGRLSSRLWGIAPFRPEQGLRPASST